MNNIVPFKRSQGINVDDIPDLAYDLARLIVNNEIRMDHLEVCICAYIDHVLEEGDM